MRPLVAVASVLPILLAAAGSPVPAQEMLVPVERFDGTTSLRTRDGRERTVQVVIRNWTIPNRQRLARFPQDGFMVVHLRAGEVITVIDGQRQARREDEIWAVPAGASMSVETGTESASLQTVTVRERR